MQKAKGIKTVGIIGGFGPEATAEFYLRLVTKHRTAKDGAQPRVLVDNAPVTRALENDLLLHQKSEGFIPLLVTSAKALESAGADLVVLPCNTLHVHEQEIRRVLTIPFVSIIAETANFLSAKALTTVGFLGTSVTVKENLFQKCEPTVSFLSPNEKIQKAIDTGLDRFVATQDGALLRNALQDAFDFFLRQKLQYVLVACTDFHDVCPKTPIRVTDTLDLLVDATVRML